MRNRAKEIFLLCNLSAQPTIRGFKLAGAKQNLLFQILVRPFQPRIRGRESGVCFGKLSVGGCQFFSLAANFQHHLLKRNRQVADQVGTIDVQFDIQSPHRHALGCFHQLTNRFEMLKTKR